MERFLNLQNIERYRRLLDIADDPTQRRQIENLLAEEEEKLRELLESNSCSRSDMPPTLLAPADEVIE